MNMAHFLTIGGTILWMVSALGTWLTLSIAMIALSLGALGPFKSSKYRGPYWKWSLLLTFYFTVPVIGWVAGFIHLAYAANRYMEEKKQADADAAKHATVNL
jgi:hypothetical protein